MSQRSIILLIAATAVTVAILFSSITSTSTSIYAVPEEKQKQWTADWWKWVYSVDETNVLLDPNGTQIMKYQPDHEAYFLTGAYNSNLTRNVTVPADKPILLPVLNGIQWCTNCDVLDTIGLRDKLLKYENINENALHMEATLNGKPIPYVRITSDLFDFEVTDSKVDFIYNRISSIPDNQTDDDGRILPTVTDGYWVILENLKPGSYHLHTNGILKNIGYSTNVNYNLIIK